MKKILTSLVLAFCLIFTCVFAGCGDKELKSISVTTMPKTEYEIGEQLDFTGGELTLTYSDDSTAKLSLTDSGVSIQKPNMSTEGSKNVTVTYNSITTVYKITVSKAKLAVTFDMGYAGAENKVVKVDHNTAVTPVEAPERTGYAFLGWYVAKDGNTKYNFSTAITQNTTIYAHWGYSVEFNLNYAGAQNETKSINIGDKAVRPSANPSRDGHIFTDWYTAKECETEFDFDAAITSNTVIYAGWLEVGPDTKVYKVTFNINDGAGTKQERQVVDGQKIKSITPKLGDATLEGWYTDEKCTIKYDFNTAVTSNIQLYAKWSADSYPVTFHYNHANNDGVYTVMEGIAAGSRIGVAPANPILDGYYFSGWYGTADCSGDEVAIASYRVNGFTHFYAKWLKEWEFQAEYTDFGQREAFGYSANGKGPSAFIMSNNADKVGAHDGHWVANLHNVGLYVEFVIESDAEVFDAALVMRISADFYDIELHKDNFQIIVNETVIDGDYLIKLTDAVAPDAGGIQNKRPFTNHTFLTGLHLVKGTNTIRFNVVEEKRYGEVGTMYATAPMIDSIYVNCNANLSWNPILTNI